MNRKIPHSLRFHVQANFEGWVAGIAAAGVAVSAGSAIASGIQKSDAQSSLDSALSKKPKIVPYTPEDPSTAFNEYNTQVATQYPTLEKDANMFNTTDNTNYQNMLSASDPGLMRGIQLQGQDADSLLHGNIPADVQSQVTRDTAQQALSGGYGPGSGASNALTARDLATTSLNLENQGSTMLASGLANAKAVNPYDFTGDSLMLTPQQELSRDDSNSAYANGVLNANNNIQYQNGIYSAAAASYNPTGAGVLSGIGSLTGAAGQRTLTAAGNSISGAVNNTYTNPNADSYDAASSMATSGGSYNPYLDSNNYDDEGSFIGNASSYGGG